MIVIVDYGMGNLGSIANMLKKVKAEAVISSRVEEIDRADKLILPGVGAFDNGMQKLGDRNLIPLLNRRVLEERVPILGLCLGMQLFTQSSEEGALPGLGWFEARTVRFSFAGSTEKDLKIPHMGWGFTQLRRPNPLCAGLEAGDTRFYFAHSFYVTPAQAETVLATSHYGHDFAAIIGRDNIVGTQFHPEKSHRFGMSLLANFAERFQCI